MTVSPSWALSSRVARSRSRIAVWRASSCWSSCRSASRPLRSRPLSSSRWPASSLRLESSACWVVRKVCLVIRPSSSRLFFGVHTLRAAAPVLFRRLDAPLQVGPLLGEVARPELLLLAGRTDGVRDTPTASAADLDWSSCDLAAAGRPGGSAPPAALLRSRRRPRPAPRRPGRWRRRPASETPPWRSRMPSPWASVGMEPQIPQPSAASSKAPRPARASQPRGSVTCTSWSSCSGEESRSSATLRKITARAPLRSRRTVVRRRDLAGAARSRRWSSASRVPVWKRRSRRERARASCAETSACRAEVSRSRWVMTSSRVEVPALQLLLLVDRPPARTGAPPRAPCSSWRALRPTASSAVGTSAPISLASRSTVRALCRRAASAWSSAPRARWFRIGSERLKPTEALAPGTLR